eukprot:3126241-Rhodomonas_salina.1
MHDGQNLWLWGGEADGAASLLWLGEWWVHCQLVRGREVACPCPFYWGRATPECGKRAIRCRTRSCTVRTREWCSARQEWFPAQ